MNKVAENIFLTVIGGIGLLVASLFLNSMLSSPPSRAEFNSLKTELRAIHSDIEELKSGQRTIIEHLMKE